MVEKSLPHSRLKINMQFKNKICLYCGKPFAPKNPQQQYCQGGVDMRQRKDGCAYKAYLRHMRYHNKLGYQSHKRKIQNALLRKLLIRVQGETPENIKRIISSLISNRK